MRFLYLAHLSTALVLSIGSAVSLAQSVAPASDSQRLERYSEHAKPLLEKFCYDCHGNGANEGNRAFDALEAKGEFLNDPTLWSLILKNVRAGVMPPQGSERPSREQIEQLSQFAKRDVFKIDPKNPDPGRVVLRRLNRAEYQNTIRDLLGYDYDVVLHFPPDDTGYGFDTIGEVLTVSPLLTEKYLAAAESIVDAAVPKVSRKAAEKVFRGRDFVDTLPPQEPQPEAEMPQQGRRGRGGRGGGRGDGRKTGEELRFEDTADLAASYQAPHEGHYDVSVELRVDGQFEYNPLRSHLKFFLDDEELVDRIFVYHDGETYLYRFAKDWQPGEHKMRFEVRPLPPDENSPAGRPDVFIRLKVVNVRVTGPTSSEYWVKPPNFERLYSRDMPPESPEERLQYAREVLRKFATRAFRRPVKNEVVESLVQIAATEYEKPGKTFEEGIARSIIAILASPRFLYRIEEPQAKSAGEQFPLLDDYALASRLSYFLWSTMPDDELFRLAEAGTLREHWDEQVDRLLKDDRSRNFVENFAGQWLRSRDVAHIRIDAAAVATGDLPPMPQQEGFNRRLNLAQNDIDPTTLALQQANQTADQATADQTNNQAANNQATNQDAAQAVVQDAAQAANLAGDDAGRGRRGRGQFAQAGRGRGRGRGVGGLGRRGGPQFDADLRKAMQQETEMQFAHIMRDDRSLLELLDANYTFLNQRLAEHYKIEGVTGTQMRLVELDADSPRGGILTQGTMLTITSNPDRTSPVKRGLFILENILGTPPPPPPANVPDLDESTDKLKGKTPTLREVLEAHRAEAICANCHARMDPLGFALENFNAMGTWRTTDKGEAINPAGKLISGEEFDSIKLLKKILKDNKKRDFYYCVTDKLMTYALGRGAEYYDLETIDQIVDELDKQDGKFSVLMKGILKSPQFQRQRLPNSTAVAANNRPEAAASPNPQNGD